MMVLEEQRWDEMRWVNVMKSRIGFLPVGGSFSPQESFLGEPINLHVWHPFQVGRHRTSMWPVSDKNVLTVNWNWERRKYWLNNGERFNSVDIWPARFSSINSSWSNNQRRSSNRRSRINCWLSSYYSRSNSWWRRPLDDDVRSDGHVPTSRSDNGTYNATIVRTTYMNANDNGMTGTGQYQQQQQPQQQPQSSSSNTSPSKMTTRELEVFVRAAQ